MSTKTDRTEIDPPAESACAACPWRTSNHRRRHPDSWYTDANRRRLWNGIRTGEAPGMTCHPTDPNNQPVGQNTRTRECTGIWTLVMRELKAFEHSTSVTAYRRGRSLAMNLDGLAEVATAIMLPPPLGRGLNGTTIPNDTEISLGLGTGR